MTIERIDTPNGPRVKAQGKLDKYGNDTDTFEKKAAATAKAFLGAEHLWVRNDDDDATDPYICFFKAADSSPMDDEEELDDDEGTWSFVE